MDVGSWMMGEGCFESLSMTVGRFKVQGSRFRVPSWEVRVRMRSWKNGRMVGWRRLACWEAGLVVGVVYMVAEDVTEVGEEFDGRGGW